MADGSEDYFHGPERMLRASPSHKPNTHINHVGDMGAQWEQIV